MYDVFSYSRASPPEIECHGIPILKLEVRRKYDFSFSISYKALYKCLQKIQVPPDLELEVGMISKVQNGILNLKGQPKLNLH